MAGPAGVRARVEVGYTPGFTVRRRRGPVSRETAPARQGREAKTPRRAHTRRVTPRVDPGNAAIRRSEGTSGTLSVGGSEGAGMVELTA